jgi:hypothetical protein
MDTTLKTQFDMKELIERCFRECEESGHIKVTKKDGPATALGSEVRTIVNLIGICDHIYKTLMGELLEFEIIRKLGPTYRTFRSIERDLERIETRSAIEANIPSLRIGQK